MRLVPFKAQHMLLFSNRDNVIQDIILHEQKEHLGPAFTGFTNEGKIVGCAGIMIMWPGVGIAWCAFAEDIREHGLWMTGMVKRVMQDVIRNHNLHRLEAVVLSDNMRNVKWIEALGFTREENSVARKYTQDRKDVYRYEYVMPS